MYATTHAMLAQLEAAYRQHDRRAVRRLLRALDRRRVPARVTGELLERLAAEVGEGKAGIDNVRTVC